MSKEELTARIEKVAEVTDKTRYEIAAKLIEKDHWTWHLVRSAAV